MSLGSGYLASASWPHRRRCSMPGVAHGAGQAVCRRTAWNFFAARSLWSPIIPSRRGRLARDEIYLRLPGRARRRRHGRFRGVSFLASMKGPLVENAALLFRDVVRGRRPPAREAPTLWPRATSAARSSCVAPCSEPPCGRAAPRRPAELCGNHPDGLRGALAPIPRPARIPRDVRCPASTRRNYGRGSPMPISTMCAGVRRPRSLQHPRSNLRARRHISPGVRVGTTPSAPGRANTRPSPAACC